MFYRPTTSPWQRAKDTRPRARVPPLPGSSLSPIRPSPTLALPPLPVLHSLLPLCTRSVPPLNSPEIANRAYYL